MVNWTHKPKEELGDRSQKSEARRERGLEQSRRRDWKQAGAWANIAVGVVHIEQLLNCCVGQAYEDDGYTSS